jgi:hypothetical protein
MATSSLKKTAQRSGPVIDRTSSIPADELTDWLDSDVSDPQPAAPSETPGKAVPAKEETAVVAGPLMEPVIRRLMEGAHKAKFLLLADWFESAVGDRQADVCVEIQEVGDIFFEVIDWISTPGFIKIVVDGSRMRFTPKLGAQICLRRRGETYLVTCVSTPTPMFGDLPFAEILFVVDGHENLTQENMEKNARITPGVTPSAVSGKPSTSVDNDEPVADGEKAASARGALPERDFDVSREYEED